MSKIFPKDVSMSRYEYDPKMKLMSLNIQAFLQTLGFIKYYDSALVFIRKRNNNVIDNIVIGTKFENDLFSFVCSLGIRFENIEALLYPSSEKLLDTSTINQVIHADDNISIFEGQFSNEKEFLKTFELLKDKIYEAEKNFFIPYSKLSYLYECLQANNTFNYFIISKLKRKSILSAIAYINKETLKFERISDSEIETTEGYDIIGKIIFFTTKNGGMKSPIFRKFYGFPFNIQGYYYDAWLLLDEIIDKSKAIYPGDEIETKIIFRCPHYVLPFFNKTKNFKLEFQAIGEGEVIKINTDKWPCGTR